MTNLTAFCLFYFTSPSKIGHKVVGATKIFSTSCKKFVYFSVHSALPKHGMRSHNGDPRMFETCM